MPLKAVPAPDCSPSTIDWRPWEGGRYRQAPDGSKTFYIRQSIAGRRYEFSLGDVSRTEALAEMGRFTEAVKAGRPALYKTPKQRLQDSAALDSPGVALDGETLSDFLEWARKQATVGKLTDKYVEGTLRGYMTWWVAKFLGRSLKDIKLSELQAALVDEMAEHKRITALKAFTRWARVDKAEPRLGRSDDPTLDLETPPAVPEKSKRKKGYTIAQVEALYTALPSQSIRDMIRLRIGAGGIHDSEIHRLAKGDRGEELREVNDPSGIFGVLVFPHKNGKEHRVSVDEATFRAAQRLRARGSAMGSTTVRWALIRVAIAQHGCGGRKISYGKRSDRPGEVNWRHDRCKECPRYVMTELRHSFATWARNVGVLVRPRLTGVAADSIAEVMGHGHNVGTTRGFYIGDYIPDMVKLPVRLVHPEDPK
ncbi:MAG: hypothetical protein NVS3B25_09730 [Hymenobacter sp.]